MDADSVLTDDDVDANDAELEKLQRYISRIYHFFAETFSLKFGPTS